MTPLFFLSLAIAVPLLGLAVVAFVSWVRRDRWDDGMKAFEQRRQALASARRHQVSHPQARVSHPQAGPQQREFPPGP